MSRYLGQIELIMKSLSYVHKEKKKKKKTEGSLFNE